MLIVFLGSSFFGFHGVFYWSKGRRFVWVVGIVELLGLWAAIVGCLGAAVGSEVQPWGFGEARPWFTRRGYRCMGVLVGLYGGVRVEFFLGVWIIRAASTEFV